MEPIWIGNYESGVPRDFTPSGDTLNTLFSDTVAKYPESPVCYFFGRKFTFGEIEDMTLRLAAVLRKHGIEKGDRVAIILPNLPQYFAAHYAIMRIGATVVPTNPLYTDKELAHQMKD